MEVNSNGKPVGRTKPTDTVAPRRQEGWVSDRDPKVSAEKVSRLQAKFDGMRQEEPAVTEWRSPKPPNAK